MVNSESKRQGSPPYERIPFILSDLREIDKLEIDFSSSRFFQKFDLLMDILRKRLTVNGVTSIDHNHPLVIEIWALNSKRRLVYTSLLISPRDCYSYAFYANNRWHSVRKSPYALRDADGVAANLVSYDSGYTSGVYEKVGIPSVVNALENLVNSSDATKWRKHFLHLSFILLESARFPEICYFVRESLNKSFVQVFYEETVGGYYDSLIHSWGDLSTALVNLGCTGKWVLHENVRAKLNLPFEESDQIARVKNMLAIIKCPTRRVDLLLQLPKIGRLTQSPKVCLPFFKIEFRISNVKENDKFSINFSSKDFQDEFSVLIMNLRGRLGRPDSDICHPVLIDIRMTDSQGRLLTTAILVNAINCKCEAFLANSSWRTVKDSSYTLVDENLELAEPFLFDCERKFDLHQQIGVSTIEKALFDLVFPNPSKWKHSIDHLCFSILEASKLVDVFHLVQQAFDKSIDNKLHCEPIRGYYNVLISSWGLLTEALITYERTGKWILAKGTVHYLHLPEEESGQITSVKNCVRIKSRRSSLSSNIQYTDSPYILKIRHLLKD